MNKLPIRLFLSLLLSFQASNAGQPVASEGNYIVKRVPGADGRGKGHRPVLDGVISPGEWVTASPAAGGFTLLREWPRTDNQNIRFRMLWDDEALYILGQIDYGGWQPSTDLDYVPFDGAHDNVNLYFCPRPSDPSQRYSPDGYQIAWHIDQGFAMRNPGRAGDYKMGMYFDAHVDTLFGNQANWYIDGSCGAYGDCAVPGLQIAQRAGQNGCVIEVRIEWEAFNAPDGEGAPLYHPAAPKPGDQWAFEWGQITSDPNNLYPSWSDRAAQAFGITGRAFFAEWPHGTLTFLSHP